MCDLDAISNKPISIVTPITDNQAVIAGFRSQISALNAPDNARFIQLIAGYDTSRLPAQNATEGKVDAYIREVSGETSSANSRDAITVVNTQSFLSLSGTRQLAWLPPTVLSTA